MQTQIERKSSDARVSAFVDVDGIPVIEELKSRWLELAREFEQFKESIPYAGDIYTGTWLVGTFRTQAAELDDFDMPTKRAAVASMFPAGVASASDQQVSVAFAKSWLMRLQRNRLRCRRLVSILDSYCPEACTAYKFSTMNPGAQAAPHSEADVDCLRVHVCIKEADDCWLSVNGEKRTWRNGQAWAFDAASMQSAEHHGTTERTVIVADFKKDFIARELAKLPRPPRQSNVIATGKRGFVPAADVEMV